MSDSPPPTGKPLTQAAPPPPNPSPTTWREEVADWQPVSIPGPLLAASAGAVVLTSLAVNRSVAATVVMALAVWALCLTVSLFKSSNGTTWLLSAGASLLAVFLVLRDDDMLTALNVIAIILLILTAASGDGWKTLFDIGLWYPFRRLGQLTEASLRWALQGHRRSGGPVR